ncbi:MAG: transcriptional regulator [Dehalococcoidia bacterium]
MNRRELLRLMSLAGMLMATVQIEDIDWERLEHAQAGSGRLNAATVNEYQALNSHLWRVFVLSKSKSAAMPFVRDQLEVLVNALRRSHGPAIHRQLCGVAGELFQLAGEIYFDGNEYTSAAHCYTLGATASKEAGAFDLWACALTRHAYISVYEEQFRAAAPVLELAAVLAGRGDSGLSTRHWVAAVQAETFAGLGDLSACQRALDMAERVAHIEGVAHNGGWLRFDGSRLEEQRGTCYVQLGQPDRAAGALTDALRRSLSTRRRGGVLTDLAMVGVQRSDPAHITTHAEAALAIARQTGSGFIAQRLRVLQAQLTPFLAVDKRVRRISNQITALST